MDYETTLLRDIFIEELKTLDTECREVFDKIQHKRDFDIAVYYCDNEFLAKHINV
jgi:hypothetical protein